MSLQLIILGNKKNIYGAFVEDFYSIILLFVLGAVAGFINVMAGGGSSITLPALIFLGLDPNVANGTNRIALIFQNLSAAVSFKREDVSQLKISILLAFLTLPGAIIGAVIATNISNYLFKQILGIVMIAVVITMVLPKKVKEEYKSKVTKIPWTIYPVMFFIGFYGGFIQLGVGFLLMAALHYILKVNLVFVNMHKVIIVLVYTIPALFIFILNRQVNWEWGLSLAIGNSIGAWWSAKLSVKKGEKIIRIVLIFAIIIMSFKLLNIF